MIPVGPPPPPAAAAAAAQVAATARRASADAAPGHGGTQADTRPAPPAHGPLVSRAGAPDPSGRSGGLVDVFA
ncbi:MAG: hypothetical protein AB7V62_08510 [Thermoleophilia bacterium]